MVHGNDLQVKGLNYLVPLDVKLSGEEEVDYECVEAGFVLTQMEKARSHMNIFIVASKDNRSPMTTETLVHRQILPDRIRQMLQDHTRTDSQREFLCV